MRFLTNRKWVYLGVVLAFALVFGTAHANADTDIFDATHSYDWNGNTAAITISVDVDLVGGLYLWQYTVTNNSFSTGNGFSGFELAMPAAPSDIGNVVSPNSNWISDCCSGQPVEWDIPDQVPNAGGSSTFGPGILVGETGVFSFTTLPRSITNSNGWFHTWVNGGQTDITFYSSTPGELGPEVPNVLLPPLSTPEPSSLIMVSAGLLGIIGAWRRKLLPS